MFSRPAFERFIREIQGSFGFIPAWPPETLIELGDVGTINREGGFQKITTLDELGVKFVIEKQLGGSSNWEYRTKGAVAVAAEAAAGKIVNLNITFKKANAILFDLRGVRWRRIDRLRALTAVLARLKTWKKDYYLVTKIAASKDLVVLMSGTENSKAVLKATADKSLTNLQANVAAATSITAATELSIKITAHQELTPLFELQRLNTSWEKVFQKEDRLVRAADKRIPSKAAEKKTLPELPKIQRHKFEKMTAEQFLLRATRPEDIGS